MTGTGTTEVVGVEGTRMISGMMKAETTRATEEVTEVVAGATEATTRAEVEGTPTEETREEKTAATSAEATASKLKTVEGEEVTEGATTTEGILTTGEMIMTIRIKTA